MPVPPATVVPKPINDLRYTLGDQGVRLDWSYPIETIRGTDINDISEFDLYRADVPLDSYCPTCPIPFGKPIKVDGGVTIVNGKQRTATYESSLLESDHKYFFKVRSRTSWWAASADSNIVTFVWSEPPSSVTGLAATAADSRVILNWKAVTTRRDGKPAKEPVQYQVYRKAPGGDFQPLGKPIASTHLDDRQVKNGKKYSYRVQAEFLFGKDLVQSGMSQAVAAVPVDLMPPAVPSGVTAVQTASGVKVIWEGSQEDDLAGYHIYRRKDGERQFKRIGTVKAPYTIYVDSGIGQGQGYYYAVTSFDTAKPANESEKSKPATVSR